MMAKPADKNIQSGNSRVKVMIYGQVNKAVRITSTGGESSVQTVDNDGSSSRIGIRAVGKANANLTIGGWHELEWQENRRSATSQDNAGNVRVRSRHVDLWLDHKNFGQVWMGHGSIAGDAAGLFSVTGTGHVFGSGTHYAADGVSAAKSDAGIASGKSRGTKSFAFFGARENRIMYVTPSLMGGRLRVSYGENKSYSVGLRYFGAPPGVKSFSSAFAAGYRYDPNEATGAARTAFAVSGGVKHSSGFNVSGGYESSRTKGSDAKPYDWFAEGGWTGKVSDMGATSLGVGYGASSDGMMGKAQQYWIAVNQKVDAAAADVYAGVAFDSGSVSHTAMHGDTNTYAIDPSDGVNKQQDTNSVFKGAEGYIPLHTADSVDAACGAVPDSDASGTIDNADWLAHDGTQCSVDRDGVVIFLVGVRIKF
ncbi:MAG: hypothetical protein OXC10_13765 [Rhodospirillaceae bacterium]|nr:hypothetical protein [Rhodospirillaceae bacterium]